MEELAFVSGYVGATNVPAVQLAEKLASLCYPSINHFFFTAGGGESNETAFKTARFFWITQGKPEKTKIISRDFGYHGVTMAAMSATGMPVFWPMFGGKLPGFLHIKSPYPYRFVSDDPSVSPGVAAANLLEKAILQEGAGNGGGFHRRTCAGFRRTDRSAGRLLPAHSRDLQQVRRAVHRRRNHHRLRPHRPLVRSRALWRRARHHRFAKGITSGYIPLGGIGLSDRVYKVMEERRRHSAGCTRLRIRRIRSAAPWVWRRSPRMRRKTLLRLRPRRGRSCSKA